MNLLKKDKEEVKEWNINVKFWAWFHVGAAVAGFVFLLVANGRMWGQLSEKGLYDVMMQVGSLGYLLVWGLVFLKPGREVLAFSFSSLSLFCLGISCAAMFKHVFLHG